MTQTLRIDLTILLPEAPDARDACVQRLVDLAATVPGVERAHIDDGAQDAGGAERADVTREPKGGVLSGSGTRLCIHYDPARVSMASVEARVRAAGAEITARYGHALLGFRAIDSEDAALRIEDGLRREPGVLAVSVNMPAQVARVEFDKRLTSEDRVALALRRLLGDGRAAPVGAAPEPALNWYARNTELAWSLAAGTLLIAAWVLERWAGLPHLAAVGLYLASYAFGAFDLVSHTVKKLRRGRFTFDIDLLMLLAAVGAALIGAWAEGAFLLFLFSLAHALEHYAMGRARDAIKALADLAPPMARVLRDGAEREVPVAEVLVGEIVIVRPGDRIAVDGKVRAGRSAVDQAPITGESVPVDKEPGTEVFAGTVNGEGALEVETTRAAGDRTLDRVVRLVTEAQTLKAPTQLFTERFERVFVPITLVAAALLIVAPPLLGVWTWGQSFYRAMTLLVAASPCAVAIGTPATVLAGIAQAARRGVLIKGGAHLENLGTIKAVAFDKTGTLTVGKPEVTDLRPAEGVSEEELLRVSAAVERRSQHPLASAIVRRAQASGIVLPEAGDLQSVTAKGVRSEVEGKVVGIGSLRLWDSVAVPGAVTAAVGALQQAGRSIVVVRHGDRWLGVIGVADQPRAGARAVLDQLRRLGVKRLVMLTGDNAGVGEAVGREVGVDEVRASLLPEDKVTAIRELARTYGSVAMVGDGVNDAPALANATVGIAMGGAGTAVALETADVRVIDIIKARLDTKTDQYLVELPSLRINDARITDSLVHEHDRMLTGGFYAEINLVYDPLIAEESGGRPFGVESLKEIQLSKRDCLEILCKGRALFTTEEWKHFLIRSVGFEPASLTPRAQDVLLLRMIPFVERNYNVVELGPRGTGKSHLYQQISPYSHLVSGGKATVARMFVNNANGQRGLVCQYDVVCFDEISGVSFDQKDGVNIMKGYMESGEFSRGKDSIRADGGVIMVGNFDVDVQHQQRVGHLFGPMPPEMRDDTALMDRIHAYIPGWEFPKIQPKQHLTDHFGLVSDFLSECWHRLRDQGRVNKLQGRVHFGGALSGRDSNGVNKSVSGLMKLLYPDTNMPIEDSDLEWAVKLAMEARRRVKEQQKRIGSAEFRNTQFSFSMGDSGVERFVSTPELQSEDSISTDPLPPGQVWAIGPGGQDENVGMFRIDVNSGPGSGVRILNQPPPGPFKESVKYAEQNLYARAKHLVGDRDPREHEFSVQLRAFDAAKAGSGLGVPALLALCSALLEKNLKGGLVVVGALNLGGSVDPVHNAVGVAEAAAAKGATALLMPISARKQLFELPDEIATKLDIQFYADSREALLKALLD